MIPKKIHYCWFGGKELPKDVKNCIKTWKKFCPEYEIIKWDESNFDVNCCEFTKEAYKNKAWAFISDYARLKVIYDNGGIYLDTDVELLKNFDDLLNYDCYLAQQQDGHFIATGLGFGAKAGYTLIKEMLEIYDTITYNEDKKTEIACPILNTMVIKEKYEYKYDEITFGDNNKIAIYPPKYFDPIAPGKAKRLLCEDTYSIHHYSASWTNPANRLKRKFSNIIGQDKINKLKEFLK